MVRHSALRLCRSRSARLQVAIDDARRADPLRYMLGQPRPLEGTVYRVRNQPTRTRVERIAKQLCTRTRDLRVLVPLTLAWTENRGLPGYVDGLQLVDAVLQKFWNDVHPRVVDGDLQAR